jgi:hypothetical protein
VFFACENSGDANVQKQFWEIADLRVDGCSSQEAVAVG